MNELSFCSSNGKPTLSYDNCPTNCVYRNNPFWNAASRDFAMKARNEAYVFLNASRLPGSIAPWSTFKNHELPELNSTNVNKLNVFLIRTPNQKQIETCETGTIKWLKETLSERNIEFSCTEDSNAIISYVCFENSNTQECSFLNNVFQNNNNSTFASNLFLMLFGSILIISIIFALISFKRNSAQNHSLVTNSFDN